MIHGMDDSHNYVDLTAPGEVESLFQRIFADQKTEAGRDSIRITIDMIVCGGDGTLHDIVDTIFKLGPASFPGPIYLTFAIIPCGTGDLHI